jgi:hypothetical protein
LCLPYRPSRDKPKEAAVSPGSVLIVQQPPHIAITLWAAARCSPSSAFGPTLFSGKAAIISGVTYPLQKS